MKRLDAMVQGVLAVGLVAAIVYGCRPAGAASDALLVRQCERHLELCRKCRARRLTPAAMLREPTPTRCYAFGAQPDPDAAQAYQFSPENSGQ